MKNIFVGLTEISGNYATLVQGLRELGYQVTFIGSEMHSFQYSKENQVGINKTYYHFFKKRSETSWNKQSQKLFYSIVGRILYPLFLIKNIISHDVFIFTYGKSFLPFNADIAFIKLLKKRIIVSLASGSDARPPYIDGVVLRQKNVDWKRIRLQTLYRFLNIKITEKFADVVIGTPLTSQLLTRPFINIFHLGVPVVVQAVTNSNNVTNGKKTVIMHAPSNMQAKGTKKIREAISNLIEKGYEIDYRELSNVTHATVLDELQRCDFVADQLYSDGPLPGLATEAAWLKKPTVIGGYGWSILKEHVPAELFPPSHLCEPQNIESEIEYMILNTEYRTNLGIEANRFVNDVWRPQLIAKKYSQLIENDYPDTWLTSPNGIIYLNGACASSEEIRSSLRIMISKFGLSSLCLKQRAYTDYIQDVFLKQDDTAFL